MTPNSVAKLASVIKVLVTQVNTLHALVDHLRAQLDEERAIRRALERLIAKEPR